MEEKYNTIVEKIKAKGYRISKPREEMIKLFLSVGRHLSIREIYDIVKFKGISMASIYRNIEILKNNGIIKEIQINETKYYELKIYSQKCIHLHFICEKCGKIIDVHNENISSKLIEIIYKLQRENNYIINDFYGVIKGICSECKGR